MYSIEEVLERNSKVEANKAWETSKTRRSVIAAITYIVATFFMWRIGVTDPYINALVPTGGYLLSTLSLSFIKRHWLKKYGTK